MFDRSAFKKQLDAGNLNLPDAALLPNSQTKLGHFFIGDSAFPLSATLMKPYPTSQHKNKNFGREERIYNYRFKIIKVNLSSFEIIRLCRARRVVENAFGLLAVRWRVLLKTLETGHETSDKIIKAACALHNFLIDELGPPPPTMVDNLIMAPVLKRMVNGERLVNFHRLQASVIRVPTVRN
jgi:hypothetical protein